MREIEQIRSEIDVIDGEMSRLLQRRSLLAEKIWQIKKAKQMSFLDVGREDLILKSVASSAHSEEEKNLLQNIFRTILIESKKYLEAKLK